MGVAIEERSGLDYATPLYPAARHRRPFVRIELFAGYGMDAVGADQRTAPARRLRLSGGAAHKVRGNAVLILGEGCQRMIGMYLVGADAVDHRIEQERMKIFSVDRILRPAIAGSQTARFRPDQLSEFVVIVEFRGFDRNGRQRFCKSKLDQLAHRIGLQIDADAQGLDLRRLLEQLYVDSGIMQAQRRGKAAYAASDDQHCHFFLLAFGNGGKVMAVGQSYSL